MSHETFGIHVLCFKLIVAPINFHIRTHMELLINEALYKMLQLQNLKTKVTIQLT